MNNFFFMPSIIVQWNEAMDKDLRQNQFLKLIELKYCVSDVDYAIANLYQWMQPEQRSNDQLANLPGSAYLVNVTHCFVVFSSLYLFPCFLVFPLLLCCFLVFSSLYLDNIFQLVIGALWHSTHHQPLELPNSVASASSSRCNRCR